MWILPKQLHTSAYVADTKELGVDSEAFSQICEKSLTWRGKDSLSPTWLRRWNRVPWIKLLSTRTLKPSHTESFEDALISSLAGSHVSHSQLLDSVKQLKTQDICSHTSETESESANLELFSSKTSQELYQPKQPTENLFSNMSSESWKAWVIDQRQEYSQRKKLAHHIRESESTSLGWSTPIVGDAHLASNPEAAQKRISEGKSTLSRQVEAKNWATPQVADAQRAEMVRTPEQLAKARSTLEMAKQGKKRGGCRNLREDVMQPQNWPTARTSDAEGGRIETEMTATGFQSKRHQSNQTFGAKLRDAVETYEENWPTPATRDYKGANSIQHIMGETASQRGHMGQLPNAVLKSGLQDQQSDSTTGKPQELFPTPRANKVHPEITEKNRAYLANRNKSNLEEEIAGHCGKATGKLNPDWVEQLMGLPTGWTDLGSWVTE